VQAVGKRERTYLVSSISGIERWLALAVRARHDPDERTCLPVHVGDYLVKKIVLKNNRLELWAYGVFRPARVASIVAWRGWNRCSMFHVIGTG
jgi:hypothetical protein